MAAVVDPLSSQAPAFAAPELPDYPWFISCTIPEGSGASGAYQGFIRPFSDDATARRALQSLEEDQPLHVSGGRLDADPPGPRDHPLAGHLIDMAVPFTVLLLEFPGSEHARTYLLDPPMVPGISESPHLRKDKPVNIDGESYSALCVYSGSLQPIRERPEPDGAVTGPNGNLFGQVPDLATNEEALQADGEWAPTR